MNAKTQPTEANIELEAGNVKDAMAGVKSGDLWQVPYEQLHILPGFNVREHDEGYEAHIENLTNLIIANGYDRTKPLSGYVAQIDGENRVVVTDGHTRYLAVGRARERGVDIKTIPLVTATRGTSMVDLTYGIHTANSGRQLAPFELGTLIKRLVGYGEDEKTIASKMGVTQGYVKDLLNLQGANKQIRDMVRSGKVSANTAIEAMKKHGAGALKALQDAEQVATAAGKKKVTAKHVAPTWNQSAKKFGPEACKLLARVQASNVFSKLGSDLVIEINTLLSELPEQE